MRTGCSCPGVLLPRSVPPRLFAALNLQRLPNPAHPVHQLDCIDNHPITQPPPRFLNCTRKLCHLTEPLPRLPCCCLAVKSGHRPMGIRGSTAASHPGLNTTRGASTHCSIVLARPALLTRRRSDTLPAQVQEPHSPPPTPLHTP